MTKIYSNVFDNCRVSNGGPCPPCREHMDLDAQILVAKQPPNNLITQQCEIRTKINALHDPITRRFSPEIVSAIFQFGLPAGWYLDNDDVYSQTQGDGSYDDIFIPHAVYGPLGFGAVCRSWRKVAWNTPSLWTNIRIFLQRRPNIDDLQVVTEWLGRSGQLPLSIRLSEYNDPDESDFEPSQRAVHNLFIDLINQYSTRWDFLEFEGLPETTSLVGKDLNSAPNLRTLSVQYARDEATIFGAMSGMKPRPTNVWARDCRFSALAIDWSHVTNVALRGVRLPECFMVLQSAPQLTHCRWSIEESNEEGLPPPPVLKRPIVHEAMQIMDFSKWTLPWPLKSGPTVFFDSFNFPGLTSYSFNRIRVTFQSVSFHLARSSCALTSLTLSHSSCDYESLVAMLQETPHLVQLTLDEVDYGQSKYDVDFMCLLANTSLPYDPDSTDEHSTVTLLPNLQSIRYTRKESKQMPRDSFWDCIPYIFGPIQQIHNPRARPLKSIRICWYDVSGKVPSFIGREAVLRLLEISAAGIALHLADRYSSNDLLKMCMAHHGIVPKT